MTFQVFAKENCPSCRKAQHILRRLEVPTEVRYVDGPEATPENVAALAWHDWVDKMPLVLVTDDASEEVVQRWDGQQVTSRNSWLVTVRDWLAAHGRPAGPVAPDTPPDA
ncbi:MAG: glutaredoxin domain-containing protein [bacterium]